MKNIRINELWIINNLEEMSEAMVNHSIEKEFYDYYMIKELDWLVENAEKIINDFYNNINKFDFDLKNNYYNFAGEWDKKSLLEAVKEMKERM